MKKNQGITLISLIITIIVMIILASTAIYSGVSTINSAKLTAFETELRIIQSEVNDLYDKYRNEETILIDSVQTNILDLGQPAVGTEADVNVEAKATIALDGAEVANDATIRANYRYFTQEYLEKLGVEGINQDFLLNIRERKVVSYQGFMYEGIRYYTLEQLTDNIYNVGYEENENIPTFETSVMQLENGKWKVSINNIQYEGNIEKWQVKYQKDGWDYWAESDKLDFIVEEQGRYSVQLANSNIDLAGKNIIVRIIPTEYQQVEYIESTGAQYIDTGIVFKADTKIITEYMLLQNEKTYIWGNSNGGSRLQFRYGGVNEVFVGYGGDSNRGYKTIDISSDPAELNKKYTVVCDKGKFYINDELITTISATVNEDDNNGLILFADRVTNQIKDLSNLRIYSHTVYQNGILVQDLVPCYRKSDNIIGMYDIVENKFYRNQGGGKFETNYEIMDNG